MTWWSSAPAGPSGPAVHGQRQRGPWTGASFVKRVVAIGGDVVGLEDGELVVNGVHVPEPWVDTESVDGVWFGPVAVPTGALFLMGDDRARSVDTSDLGPARLEDVDGRVLTPWPTG